MVARAIWKGNLKLALVSCAVELFPASSESQKIRFHTLNRDTGNRVKRQFIDSETGDVVEDDDQVKGFETDDSEYVLVEQEEIDELAIESSHTINIDKFVDAKTVDRIYYDTPYYIAPGNKASLEAFQVIREAMDKMGEIGIAHVVMYRRERVVAVEARGKGLLLTTLRYAYEMRAEDGLYDGLDKKNKSDPELIDLAEDIIKRKSGKFEPQKFTDRYEEALFEMVEAKKKGKPRPKYKEPDQPSNIISLVDALKKSLGGGGVSKAPAKKAAKRSPPKAKRKKA